MDKKKNLFMLAVSSIVCLLPIILALIVYEDIPELVALTPWVTYPDNNWFVHRAFIAFGLPLLFLVVNIIMRVALSKDNRLENIPELVRTILGWFAPGFSVIIMPIRLFWDMGFEIPKITIFLVLVGIFFIICGNYLPKTKPNNNWVYSFSWTRNDTDIWNKTHRMAGFLWVLCGITFIVVAFLLPDNLFKLAIYFAVFALGFLIPTLYSYSLSRKKIQ
jgi:uncharacterized membrane protein